jgi:capsular polysaccharide biosynthesis protein
VDLAHDYITFSLPLNNSRATGLSNFSDIIQAAQARYGARRVQVVNLSNMTLSEQAWLVLHSCIFVTYEGGGSHTSIFLPPGATVVLYNSNSIYTHVKFQAYYRDKTWYDTMAQVRKVWVSAKDRNNVALAMNLFEHYIQ